MKKKISIIKKIGTGLGVAVSVSSFITPITSCGTSSDNEIKFGLNVMDLIKNSPTVLNDTADKIFKNISSSNPKTLSFKFTLYEVNGDGSRKEILPELSVFNFKQDVFYVNGNIKNNLVDKDFLKNHNLKLDPTTGSLKRIGITTPENIREMLRVAIASKVNGLEFYQGKTLKNNDSGFIKDADAESWNYTRKPNSDDATWARGFVALMDEVVPNHDDKKNRIGSTTPSDEVKKKIPYINKLTNYINSGNKISGIPMTIYDSTENIMVLNGFIKLNNFKIFKMYDPNIPVNQIVSMPNLKYNKFINWSTLYNELVGINMKFEGSDKPPVSSVEMNMPNDLLLLEKSTNNVTEDNVYKLILSAIGGQLDSGVPRPDKKNIHNFNFRDYQGNDPAKKIIYGE